MLARLELKLRCKEELAYQMSSLFHGVLMEQLPSDYAEYLHLSQLHPYAQHLEYQREFLVLDHLLFEPGGISNCDSRQLFLEIG